MALNQTKSLTECSAPHENLLDARPIWLPTLATLIFAILTAMLGQWQWHKAELKEHLRASYDNAGRLPALGWSEVNALGGAALYRRVRLVGEFAAAYQVLLDNRIVRGRAGYHVLTPLWLEQRGAVLVNRGWQAAEGDRQRLPEIVTPKGTSSIEGILVHARTRYLELAAGAETGRLWQNLDLDRYQTWFGSELPNWLVLQTNSTEDGLIREWPEPDVGIAKHRSYAVQWFSLCALLVGLWLYFVVIKRVVARWRAAR